MYTSCLKFYHFAKVRILGNQDILENLKTSQIHSLVPSLSKIKYWPQQSRFGQKKISKLSDLVQFCVVSLISSTYFDHDFRRFKKRLTPNKPCIFKKTAIQNHSNKAFPKNFNFQKEKVAHCCFSVYLIKFGKTARYQSKAKLIQFVAAKV